MSGSKQILLLLAVTTLIGCAPKNILFSTSNFRERSFYAALPQILNKQLKIDSVILYETTFEEKPYEGYYVVDYSEVNAQNDKNILHYKNFKGFYQKLYIMQLVTQPRDSIAIYFSIKYNAFDQCVGFGPSYIGWIDQQKKSLYFFNEMYTRGKKGVYGLRKSRLPLGLYMNANEMTPGSSINIEKLIVERSYEIGNNVVIDVARIFRDPAALKFTYLGTQPIQ
jgi:hypothetical protein